MPALQLPANLQGALGLLANQPLSDPALPHAPTSLQLPAQSLNFALGSSGSLSLTADETSGFAIINASGNGNVDGYFDLGKPSGLAMKIPGEVPALEAPVTFDSSLAYVVLTGLALSGKVGPSFSTGSGSFGLEADAALDVGSCTSFARTTGVLAALTQTITGFKTVFSSPELQAMGPNETLTLGMQGALNLSLSFSFAGLAGIAADALVAVFALSGPLHLTAAPALKVTVTFGVTDGFRLYAQRPMAGATVFSVTKSKTTSAGLSIGAVVPVAINAPQLTAWVDALLQQLNGKIPSETLQAKAADLEASLTSKLSATATAQFTYSWSRMTSDSLAVRFSVTDATLDQYLPAIVRMDLSAVSGGTSSPGVTVDRLLGKKVTEVDVGYGFSFGIAGYTLLKSQDSSQRQFIEQDEQTGSGPMQRQFSFLGKRGYDSSWFGSTGSNSIELDAATLQMLANPTATDFQVGLCVSFSWTDRFSSVLGTVADHGLVVGAFSVSEIAAVETSLKQAGLDVSAKGTATVTIKVPAAALALILPVLTAASSYRDSLAPSALARALPCTDVTRQFPQRTDVEQRTACYAQAFSQFLGADEPDPDTMANICGSWLNRGTIPVPLFVQETKKSSDQPGPSQWTATSVIAAFGPESLQDEMIHGVPRCFQLLASRAVNFQTLFPTAAGALNGLAAQDYGCRVVASLLYLAGEVVPGAPRMIERTVSFTWTDANGQAHSVVSRGE